MTPRWKLVPFPGVRSPPLRGGIGQREMALRGEVRYHTKGGFLRGAHSVRPQRQAVRMPRHVLADPGDRVLPRAGMPNKVALGG